MDIRNSVEVIAALKARLTPVERISHLFENLDSEFAGARNAAVLLCLFERAMGLELLFIRRASTLRAHSGEIAFPGGAADPGEQSAVITALREAQEEIGLESARVEVLGLLPPVFTFVSNFVITPVVAFLPSGLGPLRSQPSEVDELIMVSLPGLAEPGIAHTEEWTRGERTQIVHFYDYEAYRIWGATARIVSSLLALLEPDQGQLE